MKEDLAGTSEERNKFRDWVRDIMDIRTRQEEYLVPNGPKSEKTLSQQKCDERNIGGGQRMDTFGEQRLQGSSSRHGRKSKETAVLREDREESS